MGLTIKKDTQGRMQVGVQNLSGLLLGAGDCLWDNLCYQDDQGHGIQSKIKRTHQEEVGIIISGRRICCLGLQHWYLLAWKRWTCVHLPHRRAKTACCNSGFLTCTRVLLVFRWRFARGPTSCTMQAVQETCPGVASIGWP